MKKINVGAFCRWSGKADMTDQTEGRFFLQEDILHVLADLHRQTAPDTVKVVRQAGQPALSQVKISHHTGNVGHGFDPQKLYASGKWLP